MKGSKLWSTFVVLLILSMVAPVSAAPVPQIEAIGEPAARTAPSAQETEVKSYLLQLDMPDVNVSEKTPPGDVPGVYHGALSRRWTEVEGVLKALQEIGLVETYTLVPEANAFTIVAQPAAEEQLARLGALSEQGRFAPTAIQADQFQAQLDAAIQETQERAVQARPPEEEPAAPEEARELEGQEPTPLSTEAEAEEAAEGDAFLVQLDVPDDRRAADEQQHQMDAYLDWLVREGEVAEYAWLPQAYAFRVAAEGELERLSGRPEVAEIVEYSEEALHDAQAGFDKAQAAWAEDKAPLAPLGITAHTPTTPSVEIRLYDYYVYAESYTNTTTVFTLTTSGGVLKNDPNLTGFNGWYGSYYAHVYLYDQWWNSVSMEPGDILYVAQEGEASYSITLPDLTANADPDTDTVTGEAPANISSTDPITPPALEVSVNGSQWVTTTATGAYEANNVGDFDPGDTGEIRYYDANSNQVYRDFGVPIVYVRGYDNGYDSNNRVSGYVAESNAPITVTLTHGGSDYTGYDTSGSNGYFSVYLSQDIQDDDRVEVACGGATTIVDVPTFNPITSDPDTDTVTGNTDADVVTNTYGMTLTLAVWPDSTSDGGYGKYVTTTVDGDFTAENPFYDDADPSRWSSIRDWDMGEVGHLRYVNADGNRVYTRFNAPYPPPVLYVRGYRDDNSYQAENSIGGYVTGCQDEDVDLLIEDSTGTTKDQESRQCNNSGSFYWYISGIIEPGDVVSATFAGKTTTVTVPYFEADADVDADMVTGVISDVTVVTDTYGLTQTLAVWPQSTYDWNYGKYVLLDGDGDGAFTATNPFYDDANPMSSQTDLDINYGDVGHARYTDEDENRVYFRFQPPPGAPMLYVRGWDDYDQFYASDRVGGYVPGYCDSIHGYGVVTLLDSSGAVKAQDTQVEACDDIRADLNVNIEAGDVVSATFAGKTTQVTVPAFDAQPDTDADTVTGNTDATVVTTTLGLTQTLAVWPHSIVDWDYGKHVLPDGSGDFTAANPFYDDANHSAMSMTLDIQPGDLGHLRYIDADENRVYDSFRAPMFYVRGDSGGYQGDDYVRAAIDPNTEIEITLRRGGNVLATVSGVSNNNGDYWVSLTDIYNNPVYIQAGDEVEFAFGGDSVTVDVPMLEATADAQADEVSGVGPADIVTTTAGLPHTLRVRIGGIDDYTTTGADGSFVVTGTIDPGNSGWLRYVNQDSYYVYDDFRAPVTHVRGQSDRYQADNYVSGYAPQGNVLVTLNLKRDGSTVATAYDRANNSGWYKASFRDAYGNAVNIQGDDEIEIVAGGATTTVDVPTFDVTSDPNDDAVYGVTNADVVTDTISSYGMTQTLSIWPNRLDDSTSDSWRPLKNALPDASGHFTAANPFYYYDWWGGWYTTTKDIQPGDHGHLRYIDGSGNRVYADFIAEREVAKPVVYVRGNYWNNRYESDNYVSGYAAGCSHEPVTIVIQDSDGNAKGQTTTNCDSNGRFSASSYTDRYGNNVNIEAGDTIAVTFEGQTTEVDVPEFDFTSDPDDDLVWGWTDADVVTDTYGLTRTLAVWPTSDNDSNDGKYVMQRITGTLVGFYVAQNPFYQWADPANPEQFLDWNPGDSGHLRYVDENGNRVYDSFQAPQEYAKPQVYVRGYKFSGSPYGYYQSDNYVRVYNPDCGTVHIVLKDSSDVVKAESWLWVCNWGSTYLSEDIKAGDTVEATYGDATTVVEVPDFDVTSDHVNDRVIGTTDATVVTDTYGLTQTLAVWPTSYYDWDYGKHVLPDANDAFTATNPFYDDANPNTWWWTNLDWDAGQQGHLRYVDANDNRVYDNFAALHDEPEIWVHKDGSNVWGYIVTGDETPVTVTLQSDTTTKAYATADETGRFDVNFYDSAGNPVIIKEGDDVLVETPDMAAVTVPVVHLTGQADVNDETVSGEGPADDLVNVIVNPTWWNPPQQSAATDDKGAYNADFKGIHDIQPGNQVEVQHRNDDGHTVYIDFYAGPKLVAQLNSYYAWGYSVAANAPVTITLKDGDGAVKGSDTDVSDWNNYFSAYLYDATGQRAIIEAGDVLVAEFGSGAVVSMTVAGMTADVDADADTISGAGPANDHLGVSVGNFDETVPTGGDGAWSADASDDEDIEPGDQVLVKHINENYHETWLYAVAPVVYVRARGDWNTAYQADNYVSGWAQGRSVIDVTLKRGAETIATRRLDYGGNDGPVYYSTYLYDALGVPADIQGGDQVIVSASPDETIDVPDIDAEVDADTDTITGTTSINNADLGVYVNGYNRTVHTDASGFFTVTVGSINPGNYARVRYQNDDGHWIHARFQAQSTGDAKIYARWNGGNVCRNCASGQASASNVVATVALKRAGSTIATATDLTNNDRWFNVAFTDDAGEAVDIKQGDVIEVSSSQPVSMTVEELTVEADAETDRLYGTGPAGGNLQFGGDCGGTTTIADDGTWWHACNLWNGSDGYLYYTHDDGHRTYLSWAVPFVAVHEHGNYVDGTVRRGAPVTVTLLSSTDSERAVETTTSSGGNGWFGIHFQDAAGNPIIIQPNDTVVVQASPAINVPVTPLSAEVDVANDQVTGSGPANENLGVNAGGCWRNVTTDAGGNYTADVSGECDLKAGDWIYVRHQNTEGNQVYIGFNAPMVRVNSENDIVDGYATPNATAQLTLTRGGAVIATTTASTGMDGWFSAFFTDADGDLVDIQAGDMVQVTASPTVDLDVVDLSASVNVANDTITGSGPANSLLLVRAVEPGIAWSQKSVQTDGDGNFTANFSGQFDITSVGYAYVRYTDAEGNQTSVHTTPDRSPLLDAAKQAVEARGGTVEKSAFDAANGGDLTPPITYQGGGQKLIFASQDGDLVLTRPDGSVDDEGDTRIVVENAPDGLWQVQVRIPGGGEGEQYAVAIGKAEVKYDIYLPLVMRNAGQ